MLRPSIRRSAAALLVALIAAQVVYFCAADSKAVADASARDAIIREDETDSQFAFSRTLQTVRIPSLLCHTLPLN